MAVLHNRSKLPKGDFALPSKRKFPIPDISHARNALARANQGEGDPDTIRAAVYAKYPSLKKSGKKKGKSGS
jgi:hypothetical protein